MKRKFVLIFLLILTFILTGCQIGQIDTAPIISSFTVKQTTVEPGGQIQLQVKATDPEKKTLTYIWTATGGTIDGTGSSVTWNAPKKEDAYTVTVKVSDGKHNITQSKELTVKINNQSPTIVSLTADKVCVEPSDIVNLEVTATDPNGDSLTYSWTATGGTIEGAGNLGTWQAPEDEGTYTVTTTVSDGKLEVSESKAITVEVINRAPMITSFTVDQSNISPLDVVNLQVEATDPNGDSLTYTWTVTGGTIEGTGNLVTWQAPEDEGTYTVTITVSDGELTMSQSKDLVIQINNQAPSIVSFTSEMSTVEPESSTDFSVEVVDPNNDDLTVVWNATAGSFEGSGYTVHWIAPQTEGNYTITVTISDGQVEVSESKTIAVVKTNEAPVIKDITVPATSVTPLEHLPLQANFSDPDGDALTFIWTATDGTIEGTNATAYWDAPTTAGSYTITVIVSDGTLEATHSVVLTVINEAPVISNITADKTLVEPRGLINLQADATDANLDELTYTWTTTGGHIENSGQAVVWEAPEITGSYTITLTVSDGTNEVTAIQTVQVYGRPTITNLTLSAESVSVGGTIDFNVTAANPNDDQLTYLWEDESGQTLGTDSFLNWQAPTQVGTYAITVRVNNQRYEVSKTAYVHVTDANHHLPLIGEVLFLVCDDLVTTPPLAADQGYAVAIMYNDPDESDSLTSELVTENGSVQKVDDKGFTFWHWTTPSEPGDYSLTFTISDGTFNMIHEYTATVEYNNRPVLNGIYINDQLVTNNYIELEPGTTANITVDLTDADNDIIEANWWSNLGPSSSGPNLFNYTCPVPMTEEMNDIGIILFDGKQLQLVRFTIHATNGIDDSPIDIAISEQINQLANQFALDFATRDIVSIQTYTHPDYLSTIETQIDDYYYWGAYENITLTNISEVTYDGSFYIVDIALNGDHSMPWDSYPYNVGDSLRLTFKDYGTGTILLTDFAKIF